MKTVAMKYQEFTERLILKIFSENFLQLSVKPVSSQDLKNTSETLNLR